MGMVNGDRSPYSALSIIGLIREKVGHMRRVFLHFPTLVDTVNSDNDCLQFILLQITHLDTLRRLHREYR